MLITAVAFIGTAQMRDHSTVCTQYIVGPWIVVFVRRFLACPQWYQAATVILATRSSSVTTMVAYTRSPDLTCLDFFLWGHIKQLVYETVVKKEADLVARITVAAGTPLRTCQESSSGHSIIRRCTACIQTNGRAFEQFL